MGNLLCKKKKEENVKPKYEPVIPRDRRGSIEQEADDFDDSDEEQPLSRSRSKPVKISNQSLATKLDSRSKTPLESTKRSQSTRGTLDIKTGKSSQELPKTSQELAKRSQSTRGTLDIKTGKSSQELTKTSQELAKRSQSTRGIPDIKIGKSSQELTKTSQELTQRSQELAKRSQSTRGTLDIKTGKSSQELTKTSKELSKPSSRETPGSKSSKDSRVPKPFKEYLEDTEGAPWYLDNKGILTKVDIPKPVVEEKGEDPNASKKRQKEKADRRKSAQYQKKLEIINKFLERKHKISPTTGQKYIFRESIRWHDLETLEILKYRMKEENITFQNYTKLRKNSSSSTKSLPLVKPPWQKYVNSTNPHLKTPDDEAIHKMSNNQVLQVNQFEINNCKVIQNLCLNYQKQQLNPPQPCQKVQQRFSDFESQFKKSMFRQDESGLCGCDIPKCSTQTSTRTSTSDSGSTPCCASSTTSRCDE